MPTSPNTFLESIQKTISRFTGWAARKRLPFFLRSIFLGGFARTAGINRSEIPRPLDSFESLSDFFSREIDLSLRPIGEGVVSPVDGAFASCGLLQSGCMIQAKGRDFQLLDLVEDTAIEKHFSQSGAYYSLYLSPRDYHRIHSPIAGRLLGWRRIPGGLWPVNDWGRSHVDKLYCRNERVVCLISGQEGLVCLVIIGALNVGGINMSCLGAPDPDCIGHGRWLCNDGFYRLSKAPICLERGQEIARFELGSSVVVITEGGQGISSWPTLGAKVQMGQTLYVP